MTPLRIYVDTSVIGGCRDEEFREDSEALMAMAQAGSLTLLISPILAAELRRAPAEVQEAFDALSVESLEELPLSPEAETLRDAYLAAGVVGEISAAEAHHVALATVARADMIVSWNFRHIVHYDKIRGFNAVNLRMGYPSIAIHSPKEVV